LTSLKWIACFWVVVGGGTGCGGDQCEQVCIRSANYLDACMEEWPADQDVSWSLVDADSRADFRNACVTRWAETRATLETREFDDALDQCEETLDLLSDALKSGTACDELRALFLFE